MDRQLLKFLYEKQFRQCLMDENRPKLYNPHCPNWKKCRGGNVAQDCFGCGNMNKISGDYLVHYIENKTRRLSGCLPEKF